MQNLMRAVFLGTPEITLPTLEFLNKNNFCKLVLVVTQPSRPKARGQEVQMPAVGTFCDNHHIPFVQTENINRDEILLKRLIDLKPDIFLVFAFGQFLGERALNIPKLGCFNIHASLLPKYRGAAPIQYALLNNDKTTGISIQRMVKKMDAGDICSKLEIPINDSDTAETLAQKISRHSPTCLNEFLHNLSCNNIVFTPQNESLVSFAPTIKKDDGKINFSQMTTQDCINRLRAFSPWPSIFCYLSNKRLKILQLLPSSKNLLPGEISTEDNYLCVGCINGSLRLSLVQLEGKKPCSDRDLLNGFKGPLILT